MAAEKNWSIGKLPEELIIVDDLRIEEWFPRRTLSSGGVRFSDPNTYHSVTECSLISPMA